MKIFSFLISTVYILWVGIISVHPVIAASTKLTISYEPVSPQFSIGKQNVVTVVITPASGTISAAVLTITTTGGVKIVNVLDATDKANQPLRNTKYIRQEISDRSTTITILMMRSTADLPTQIKVPVVVTGEKAGNVQIDTKESQITDENGNAYQLSSAKAGYITFSENGKDTITPPSPTPLPTGAVTMNLSMKFQGIRSAEVKNKTISGVKVQLVQGQGTNARYSLPHYITVQMDEGGIWRGTAVFRNIIKGDKYALLIKGPKHLQKRVCQNEPSETKEGTYACNEGNLQIGAENSTINMTGITQMVGDVGIQDSVLNGYDLSFVLNTLRKSAKNSLSDADVNYDGKVNKTDVDLLVYTLKNTSGFDQR